MVIYKKIAEAKKYKGSGQRLSDITDQPSVCNYLRDETMHDNYSDNHVDDVEKQPNISRTNGTILGTHMQECRYEESQTNKVGKERNSGPACA